MKSALTMVILAVLMTSCSLPSPQTRISKNGGMYSKLSPEHRRLVATGQITKGMPKDAVYLAWGTPSKVYKIEDKGTPKIRWVYTRSKPAYTTSVGIGYGGYPHYRRYGYYGGIDYGPRTVYLPEQIGQVIFTNGKVESWERKE